MEQKVIKAGNSTAVVVPAEFVRAIGVKIGENVAVEYFIDQGRVEYQFAGVKQLPLSSELTKKRRR